MPGKLIVVEGTDGSGKATQSKLLFDTLQKRRPDQRLIKADFPRYRNPMAASVEAYLSGQFGTTYEVGPYAGTMFYLVDQYTAVRTEWQDYYDKNATVVSDRYYTSSMLHQSVKLDNPDDRRAFIAWLHDFTDDKLQMPKPDLVFYLNVPIEYSNAFLNSRRTKDDTNVKSGIKHDIHENDLEYQKRCKLLALDIVNQEGWHVIQCVKNGTLRSIEDIHQEMLGVALKIINETD